MECNSNSSSVKEVIDIPETPDSGQSPCGKENIGLDTLESESIQDVVDSCSTESEMMEIRHSLKQAHRNIMNETELARDAKNDLEDDIEFEETDGFSENKIDSKLDDCLVTGNEDEEDPQTKPSIVDSPGETRMLQETVDMKNVENVPENMQCDTDNNFECNAKNDERKVSMEVSENKGNQVENENGCYKQSELPNTEVGEQNTESSCNRTDMKYETVKEMLVQGNEKQLESIASKNELSLNEGVNSSSESNEAVVDVKARLINENENENNVVEREQTELKSTANRDEKPSPPDKKQNACLTKRNQFFSNILNQTEESNERNQALSVNVNMKKGGNQPSEDGDSGFLTDLFSKRDGNRPPVKTNDATG